MARPSITARAIVAERPRRFGNIARAHHAGRTHHDLRGITHGRLRDPSIEPSAYDAKLRRRRDAIPAILSRWTGGTLRSWRTCLSRRPCIASIALVTFIAFYAASAKSQRRGQDGEDKNGFPHYQPLIKRRRAVTPAWPFRFPGALVEGRWSLLGRERARSSIPWPFWIQPARHEAAHGR